MRFERLPALVFLACLFLAAAVLRALPLPWTGLTVALGGLVLQALSFTVILRIRSRLRISEFVVLNLICALLTLAFWSFMGVTARLVITLLMIVLATLLHLQRKSPIFQYLFLCRFPLLLSLALVALPFLYTGAPKMFKNLFYLSPARVGLVATLAVLLSWVVMITFKVVGGLAHHRFRVPPWESRLPRWLTHIEVKLWSFALLAVPLLFLLVLRGNGGLWELLTAAIIGALGARLVFALGQAVAELLTPHTALSWEISGTVHEGLRQRLRGRNLQPMEKMRTGLETWLRSKPPSIHEGYLNDEGRLLPGHSTALGFFAVTFAFYLVGFFAAFPAWDHPVEVPALAYVLVLMILLGWLLPFLSFFLDRFRVPTVVVLAGASFLLFFVDDIDHYYDLKPVAVAPRTLGAQETGRSLSDALLHAAYDRRRERWAWLHRADGREPVLVLVSANGGGITAALWTAHVLSSLDEAFGPNFTDGIHLVSSVSGGSVGSMYFLGALSDSRLEQRPDFDRVRGAAGSSSLAATAWGFAYPDFWRAFSAKLPFFEYLDRGWALEQAWTHHFRDYIQLGYSSTTPTLSEWERRVLQGKLPVAVFNATRSETGENLLLSSLASLPRSFGAQPSWRRSGDLSVVTAARLSAAFPFVSPIARPFGENDYHVADGGYYDNYGTTTAAHWIDWLYQTHPRNPCRPRKILLVEIRARDNSAPNPPKQRGGWSYATVGPILTLMKVRDTSQLKRNEFELCLLERLAPHRGYELKRVAFTLAKDAPLSWHLTAEERDDILSYPLSDPLEEVHEFLCSAEGWCSPDSLGLPQSPRKISCGSVDAARWAGSHAAATEIASSSAEAAARVTGSAASTP